jgi:hypothetical protein
MNKKKSFGSRRIRRVRRDRRIKKSRILKSRKKSRKSRRRFGGPSKGPIKCSKCLKILTQNYYLCPVCEFGFCDCCVLDEAMTDLKKLSNLNNGYVGLKCPVSGCTGTLQYNK